MKLNCLGCGNSINLSEEYEMYNGNIRCNVCSAILRVKFNDAKLEQMDFLQYAKQGEEISEKLHASTT